MTNKVILLHPSDDVLISTAQLLGGTTIDDLHIKGLIPPGHKIARRDIALGEPVLRYNQIIGFASKAISAGEHVHVQNLAMGDFDRDYQFCKDVKPASPYLRKTFLGIKRPNGKIATRNYIGILTSVNCSATVARSIAEFFNRSNLQSPLHQYPNIDGVVALTHGAGCGMDQSGLGMKVLKRTLSGYANHPNFAAILMVGLGCEANQIDLILDSGDKNLNTKYSSFNIQNIGGTRKAIQRGIELVSELLEDANNIERQDCGIENIIVGLQCGGSDGYSGISANPALGRAVDLLVAHGGTAILSETPEIYGAEHLLTKRALNPKVGQELVDRIRWWESYVQVNDGKMNNNPSPGNKAGGLTTILEKSLGAIAKGGTSNLNAVLQYAQSAMDTKGLVFMDTPGYDPVSATGQVAGGANIICFTTGRGSAYGCAPTPSLKLATNTTLWENQSDDIDLNCGEIIDGKYSIDEMGQKIFQEIIDCASGVKTKSELLGYGQSEFVPWQLGAVM
jgi:altronate hydrolase